MADATNVERTDATWNPITGYSASDLRRWDDVLTQPLIRKRSRKIFVCAHGDLFAEGVPDEWIDKVFAIMALAPQHTFQVLTKRPARMRAYMTVGGPTLQMMAQVPQVGRAMMTASTDWPLPNVWLGVSAEDQRRADERIPDLLATPAAVRFISGEPLLGPLDLTNLDCVIDGNRGTKNALTGEFYIPGCGSISSTTLRGGPKLDWVIVGGESGPGARPMHPAWARSLRDQCTAAGVAFHFKQWGGWRPLGAIDNEEDCDHDAFVCADEAQSHIVAPDGKVCSDEAQVVPPGSWMLERIGKKAAGRLLDGRTWDEFPKVSS